LSGSNCSDNNIQSNPICVFGFVQMMLSNLGVPKARSNARVATPACVVIACCTLALFAAAIQPAAAAASSASAVAPPNVNLSSSVYPSSLSLLHFLNAASVRSTDIFLIQPITSIYNEGYTYMGTGHSEWTSLGSKTFAGLDYLFQSNGNNVSTPPSGMRSSVPLGPLGEGSVELRADGRLADWGTIFNNGPYAPDAAWSKKIDVDEACFGIFVQPETSPPLPLLLRTHPPPPLPPDPLLSLNYSGAFPVSQLSVDHPRLPLEINLRAFSEFEMHAHNNSVAPAVFFAFDIRNPSRREAIEASLFFNLPNIIGGQFSQFEARAVKGLTLDKRCPASRRVDLTEGELQLKRDAECCSAQQQDFQPVIMNSIIHVDSNVFVSHFGNAEQEICPFRFYHVSTWAREQETVLCCSLTK
jgi:hypothetical protein